MPKSKQPNVERRASKRSRTQVQLNVVHESEIKTTSTHDISTGGFCCYLPMPLSLFTKYRFRLFVPVNEGEVREIDGEGVVVRVEEVEVAGENLFQTAFFFQQLDVGHEKVLEAYLHGKDGELD